MQKEKMWRRTMAITTVMRKTVPTTTTEEPAPDNGGDAETDEGATMEGDTQEDESAIVGGESEDENLGQNDGTV